MKELKQHKQIDRRNFISKGATLGALIGFGCPAIMAMDNESRITVIQDKLAYQKSTNLTYEQLFNFSFKTWFISYMKRLQEKIGKTDFLEMLKDAGDDHFRNNVAGTFQKVSDKSVQSLIETFWEPNQKSEFGQVTIAIEILKKSRSKGIVRMNECLYAKTFIDGDAADIGYAAICNADYAVTNEFNPAIKLTRNQCLMNGDDCCLFEYTMKG